MTAQFLPTNISEWIRQATKDINYLKRRAATNSGGGGGGIPAGFMGPYGGGTVPEGWLLCDGSVVSRVTYANLFNAIGTTYGAGDGSTTFALPNAKGRVLVGRDAAQTEFDTLGETGGAKTSTLTIAQIPAHHHQEYFSNHTLASGGGGAIGGMTSSGGAVPGVGAQQYTGLTGGDSATPGFANPHSILPPYLVTNMIIAT